MFERDVNQEIGSLAALKYDRFPRKSRRKFVGVV